MKKQLLLLSLCASLTSTFAASPTLYGVKLYCSEECSSGLYSLETTPGAQPELVWASGDMMGNGGSVYVDGTLYVLNYLNFYGTLYWSYLICDVEKKSMDAVMPDLTFSDCGSAMTFDPATGNAYSICIDADDTSSFTLSTMNFEDGSKMAVAPIERMGALAADQYGTLFGIGMDGNLYRINKFSGETTLVGSTGVTPENNQSAVIDYATGVMYWNAITADGAYLYTVDTATAEASLVTELDGNFQFAGMFIKQTAAQAGSPMPASDLEATFAGASLSGTITFTMPETDTEGNPLPQGLTYTVKCGDSMIAEGEGNPGEKAEAPVQVDAAGYRQFFVTVRSEAGESAPASTGLWVGMDTPRMVTDCIVTNDGNEVTLSWTLPETGINGGYVDPEQTRYVVIRGPYGELLDSAHRGTTFTETMDQDGVYPLMYGVYAYIDEEAVSEMVMSNVLIMGDHMTVPMVEDLTDPFRSLVFTVTDSNGDDSTWNYDFDFGTMLCTWSFADQSDDWLVTAPVFMESGKEYKVEATVRSEGKWNYDEERYDPVYCGFLGIHLGDSTTPESMTRQLAEPTKVMLNEDHVISTETFTPEADGIYHIGLHHSGPRSIYYMLLSRLEVVAASDSSTPQASVGDDISYRIVGNAICISNPGKARISLTGIDGRTVFEGNSEEITITQGSGAYVLTYGEKSAKVLIR